MDAGWGISIGRLRPEDRAAWERLFRDYIEFYATHLPDAAYEIAWREFELDTTLHAFGARVEDRLVGIAHFLIHPSTWTNDVCYLQDLFTAPECRSRGVATALIDAVSGWARERGCSRLYWMTHETNHTARRLYDRVAAHRGFIRYEIGF
jgi:GNAT superfamily N-acetyltransferase